MTKAVRILKNGGKYYNFEKHFLTVLVYRQDED